MRSTRAINKRPIVACLDTTTTSSNNNTASGKYRFVSPTGGYKSIGALIINLDASRWTSACRAGVVVAIVVGVWRRTNIRPPNISGLLWRLLNFKYCLPDGTANNRRLMSPLEWLGGPKAREWVRFAGWTSCVSQSIHGWRQWIEGALLLVRAI